MNYVVCTNHDLRMACINNRWFAAGTNLQYEKLFEMNSNADMFSLKEIAAVIYVCSDKSYAEIFERLLDLQNKYFAICSAGLYGYNSENKKIIFDRKTAEMSPSFILGEAGTGKAFVVKNETIIK